MHETQHDRGFAVDSASGSALSGDESGAGEPIVLLHGLSATRRNVVQGSRHLTKRGYRLVGYDARGHGESEPAPGYAYADLAADAGRVLDARDIDAAVLAGSSMGAHTAAVFALASPERVRALVLITPAYLPARTTEPSELAHWDELARSLEEDGIDGFVRASGAHALPERWREAAVVATRQRMERHRHLPAVARALREVPRSRALESLDELEAIEAPALVVASHDGADPGHPLAVAEEYARRLPRGQLVVEDDGQTPLAWQGARLSRTVADFLEGQ